MRSTLLALCLMSASASAAMILGFGAEADYFTPSASGNFDYKGSSSTFGSSAQSGFQVGAYLEHPVPVLPNLRIDYTSDISFSGSGEDVSFTQTDITPYYEILDNIVDIDVGITAKVFDGSVGSQSFSEVIPMGYVGAAVSLPGIPVGLSGSVKYIGLEGDSFTDARIKATWDIAAGIAAQVGYRYESIELKDRFDITADAKFKGPFVGVGFSF